MLKRKLVSAVIGAVALAGLSFSAILPANVAIAQTASVHVAIWPPDPVPPDPLNTNGSIAMNGEIWVN